ncbi:MAG TPA: hypothetical protein PKL10_02500 [Nitrospira sp.]|nr:hypothetical protein [Mycobacterium sp.]MCB0943812.1 hypothetical protein [Mycobacterium sp.]HNK15515.1 hypothetical protein [Nitrospira sp.]HNN41122.1 hypothetical protein [Nitrospira sp.]HNO87794.1 hypothetical protein [Rhodocyclaceae bacterium]
MSMKARAERVDVLPREPRCRICRDPDVRRLVNEMLDWRGFPIHLGCGKKSVVTFASILRDMEPLNEGRDIGDWITYNSLWVHAKRHYDIDGVVAYWGARIFKELRMGLRG